MNPPVVFMQAACAATLASVGGNALSLPGPRMVGHYDFGYAIRGDRPARPVQVFDDGTGRIYFEVRPGQPMPAVFAGKALDLLVTQAEGQFFTARTGAREFTLVLGAARATVTRGDAALGAEIVGGEPLAAPEPATQVLEGRLIASAAPGLPAGVRFDRAAMAAPAGAASTGELASTSYARPVRGDTLEEIEPGIDHAQPILFAPGSAALAADVRGALGALAARIGREAPVVVEGRGDASRREGLAEARAQALRAALVAGGLPAGNVSTRSGADIDETPGGAASARRVAGAMVHWRTAARAQRPSGGSGDSPPADFDLRTSDVDIAGAVRRWARDAGYDVVWDLEWTAPITGRAHLEAASFTAAIAEVVAGLRAQGYPVRAQAYADRVVRFSASD